MPHFNLKPMYTSDFPKARVGVKSDYKDQNVLFFILGKDASKPSLGRIAF